MPYLLLLIAGAMLGLSLGLGVPQHLQQIPGGHRVEIPAMVPFVCLAVGLASLVLFLVQRLTSKPLQPLKKITQYLEANPQEGAPADGQDSGRAEPDTVEIAVEALLENALCALASLVPGTLTIAVFRTEGESLRLRKFAGCSSAVLTNSLCAPGSLPCLLLDPTVPHIFESHSKGLPMPYYQARSAPPVRSFLGAPIVRGAGSGTSVRTGVIWLDSLEQGAFTRAQLAAVKEFAALLGEALFSTRALSRAVRESRRTRAFLADSRDLQYTTDSQSAVEYAGALLEKHCVFDRAMIYEWLPGGKRGRVAFAKGTGAEYFARQTFPFDLKALLPLVLLENRRVEKDLKSDTADFYDLRVSENEHRDFGFRSLLAVPVVVEGQPRMVLSLESRTPQAYAGEAPFLENLAAIFSLALERSVLLQEREEAKVSDALTGTLLRTVTLSQLARSSDPVALMLVGIDDFRSFNEAFGSVAGDRALVELARLLGAEANQKEGRLLARYGGDAFLLAERGGMLTDFKILADRLRKAWNAHAVRTDQGAVRLTASFATGLFTGADGDGAPAGAIVSELEKALHSAKSQGKNRCVSVS